MVCILIVSIVFPLLLCRRLCCLLWRGLLYPVLQGCLLLLLFCISCFFPIHLYPLMFIFCFSGSLVSVINAIWALVACSIDSRLLIFPFIPLTLHVTIIRFLFFLIRFHVLLFLAFYCYFLPAVPFLLVCFFLLLVLVGRRYCVVLFVIFPFVFFLGVIIITVFGPKVTVFFLPGCGLWYRSDVVFVSLLVLGLGILCFIGLVFVSFYWLYFALLSISIASSSSLSVGLLYFSS